MTERDLNEGVRVPDSLEVKKEDLSSSRQETEVMTPEIPLVRETDLLGVKTTDNLVSEINQTKKAIDDEANTLNPESILPLRVTPESKPKKTLWDKLTETKTVRRAKAWIAAGIAAVSLSGPLVTQAEETPPTSDVTIGTSGEMEGQGLDTISLSSGITVPEVAAAESANEAYANPVDARDKENVSKYEETGDLEGVAENRKIFCAGLYYILDAGNAAGLISDGTMNFPNKENCIRYHLEKNGGNAREIIHNFGKTGEGLENVWYLDDGTPAIWGANMESTAVKKCFSDTFEWYAKNGAPDFVEALYENGVLVLFPMEFNPIAGPGCCSVNEYGIIGFNFNEEILKERGAQVMTNGIKKGIAEEQFGILYFAWKGWNMGANFNLCEINKKLLAFDYFNALIKKGAEDTKFLSVFINGFLEGAKSYAEDEGVTIDTPSVVAEVRQLGQMAAAAGFDSPDQWTGN